MHREFFILWKFLNTNNMNTISIDTSYYQESNDHLLLPNDNKYFQHKHEFDRLVIKDSNNHPFHHNVLDKYHY